MAGLRSFESPRVVVNVSQDKIDAGVKRDSGHCMIAEALRAQHPGISHVSVDLQTIRFSDRKRRLRYAYLTPRQAQIALVSFDQGKKPEPFHFVLSGAHVVAMSARKEETRSLKKAPAKKAPPDKATIVPRGGKGSGVQVIGGKKLPPETPFARRRAFGLKRLSI